MVSRRIGWDPNRFAGIRQTTIIHYMKEGDVKW